MKWAAWGPCSSRKANTLPPSINFYYDHQLCICFISVWSPCIISSRVSGCLRNLQESQLKWDIPRWRSCTACCSLQEFFTFFIRFSEWLEITALPGFIEKALRWCPAGVWSFFQTDNRALRYAGILVMDDGGQLSAVCIKALNVLLGVILVYAFIFIFILLFCSVNLPMTWRCGPEAGSYTVIFLICDLVL